MIPWLFEVSLLLADEYQVVGIVAPQGAAEEEGEVLRKKELAKEGDAGEAGPLEEAQPVAGRVGGEVGGIAEVSEPGVDLPQQGVVIGDGADEDALAAQAGMDAIDDK